MPPMGPRKGLSLLATAPPDSRREGPSGLLGTVALAVTTARRGATLSESPRTTAPRGGDAVEVHRHKEVICARFQKGWRECEARRDKSHIRRGEKESPDMIRSTRN